MCKAWEASQVTQMQMAAEPPEDLQRSDLSEENEILARHRKEVKDLRGA